MTRERSVHRRRILVLVAPCHIGVESGFPTGFGGFFPFRLTNHSFFTILVDIHSRPTR
ncbi:MAG: hypothetical protein MI923_23810 [Phycisphaerales bacterium]|nr:hypothetical protein [Phycisphaerales bacterium]